MNISLDTLSSVGRAWLNRGWANVKWRIEFATQGKKKRFFVLLAAFLILSLGSIVRAELNEGSTMEEIEDYVKNNPGGTVEQLAAFHKSTPVTVGDLSENGAFTAFMNDMVSFAKSGITAMSSSVKGLLSSLILIEFIMVVSNWALGDNNRLGDLFWKFIKWGIYVWIVGNFESLATTFLNGFVSIGSAIGGGSMSLLENPSSIFTTFYNVAVKPLLSCVFQIEYNFSAAGIAKNILTFQAFPIIALFAFFVCLLQLVLIVLMAAQVVSTVAIYWFCAAVGYVLFPFMMLDQTRMLAGNVVTALMSGGARIATLTVVFGLGNGIIASALTSFTGSGSDSGVLMIALKTTGYIALFCWASIKLPSVVAAAVAGQGGGGMGIAGGIAKITTLGR